MAAGDLTTSDAVIAYLQTRANLSIDPALIATLITNASEFIKTYCSDRFLSQDYVELRDGLGYEVRTTQYVTAYSPITAVASVSIDGTPVLPSGPTPFRSGYLFDERKITLVGVWAPKWPLLVQLSYTAGYATIPPDLNQACVEIVAHKYLQRRRMGISSESVSEVGARTYVATADMSPDTKTVLNQRKRVAPIGNVISP